MQSHEPRHHSTITWSTLQRDVVMPKDRHVWRQPYYLSSWLVTRPLLRPFMQNITTTVLQRGLDWRYCRLPSVLQNECPHFISGHHLPIGCATTQKCLLKSDLATTSFWHTLLTWNWPHGRRTPSIVYSLPMQRRQRVKSALDMTAPVRNVKKCRGFCLERLSSWKMAIMPVTNQACRKYEKGFLWETWIVSCCLNGTPSRKLNIFKEDAADSAYTREQVRLLLESFQTKPVPKFRIAMWSRHRCFIYGTSWPLQKPDHHMIRIM